MTLRMIEGFDYLLANPGATLLAAMGWSGSLTAVRTTTTSAFGYGRSMNFASNGNFSIAKFLRGRYTTPYIFGMRMSVPPFGTGDSNRYFVRGIDSSTTAGNFNQYQWQIGFDQFGSIELYSYSGVGTLPSLTAKTAPGVFVPGNWFWLEFRIVPGYTTGAIEIRVNTVPVLSLSNIRTANGTPVAPAANPAISHLNWETNFGSIQWATDDVYFLTEDGTDNNTFLGNVRIKYMQVVSNASPIEWLIGGSDPAPTNWQSVLNDALNDTKYVYSTTPGDQDLYNVDPNINAPFVYGVEVGGAYRMDDATQRFVANVLESGGVQVDGTTQAINQSYTVFYDVYERNPATGLQFTGAEANAIKIGPKVIT